MVNLTNVDNTADANKIVSSFTRTALNVKAPMASPALNGTATAVNLTVSGNLINGTTNVLTALSEKRPSAMSTLQTNLESSITAVLNKSYCKIYIDTELIKKAFFTKSCIYWNRYSG